MRQFVVSEAPVSRVAQHVRETVEADGGIVAQHTSRKTEFDHLEVTDKAWRRAGYVGTYQRFKEKPVQVRIRVWAQWPRRLLAGSIYLGFAIALVFFLASLIEIAFPPNLWIVTSLPILAVIAAAFLMYTSSMADSEAVERRIAADLVDRINEDEEIAGEVYDLDEWTDYREEIVDDARQQARERAPHGGSRVRQALADVTVPSPSFGGDEEEAPTEAATDDADDEPGRLAATKAKLGLASDDDEEDDVEQAEPADEATASDYDEEDEGGRLAAVKAKLGLGPDDEEEAVDDEEAAQADSEETEADEGPGLVDRWKAKVGLGGDEDEADEEVDEGPEVEDASEAEEPAGAASS